MVNHAGKLPDSILFGLCDRSIEFQGNLGLNAQKPGNYQSVNDVTVKLGGHRQNWERKRNNFQLTTISRFAVK